MTAEQALVLLIYEACRVSNPEMAQKLLADAMMFGARSIENTLNTPVTPVDAPEPEKTGRKQQDKPPARREKTEGE